ncbi:hypothetical protein [Jejubacter calystegiae]|jgi:hypothetical protein|nr:hypothetical protein [Jejubacter calystegiae]
MKPGKIAIIGAMVVLALGGISGVMLAGYSIILHGN